MLRTRCPESIWDTGCGILDTGCRILDTGCDTKSGSEVVVQDRVGLGEENPLPPPTFPTPIHKPINRIWYERITIDPASRIPHPESCIGSVLRNIN